MALPTLARTSPFAGEESTELRRLDRELAAMADETLDRIAETTKALHQAHRSLERIGQLSEALRVATIPPAQRKRPARLAPDRA